MTVFIFISYPGKEEGEESDGVEEDRWNQARGRAPKVSLKKAAAFQK